MYDVLFNLQVNWTAALVPLAVQVSLTRATRPTTTLLPGSAVKLDIAG